MRTASQYLWRLAILCTQLAFTSFVILSLSVTIYALIYSKYVPRPLTREKVFFDFDLPKPSAHISLLRPTGRQWAYVNAQLPLPTDVDRSVKPWLSNRFLQADMAYNIDITVQLARSIRNLDLGKVTLKMDIVDATQATIAHSTRPIVMPFQSSLYVHLESLLTFPGRFLGLAPPQESMSLRIQMTDNFIEPPSSHPPTEGLSFTLSSAAFDLLEMEVAVLPNLQGIGLGRWLYYYPITSALVIIGILSVLQGGLVVAVVMVSWISRAVSEGVEVKEEDEEEDEVAEIDITPRDMLVRDMLRDRGPRRRARGGSSSSGSRAFNALSLRELHPEGIMESKVEE